MKYPFPVPSPNPNPNYNTKPWPLHHKQLWKTVHTILPNVYHTCKSVGVTQEGPCEPVGVKQETNDHNYFHTRSVVNKVHPIFVMFLLSRTTLTLVGYGARPQKMSTNYYVLQYRAVLKPFYGKLVAES